MTMSEITNCNTVVSRLRGNHQKVPKLADKEDYTCTRVATKEAIVVSVEHLLLCVAENLRRQ